MERNILFREILAVGGNLKSQPEPLMSFEVSEADIAKYQDFIKKSGKTVKNPSDLTNLVFHHINPALGGRKLKDTDKEHLKVQWLDIYYQVVLPFLGIKNKQRPKFEYTNEVKGEIEKLRKELDLAEEIITRINPHKGGFSGDFDNHPEVRLRKEKITKLLIESLLPILIEGLNLSDPKKVYEALMTLDDGHLIDQFVRVRAYRPVSLSEPEPEQAGYERIKSLLIRVLKGAIENYLKNRKPSDVQTSVEPGKARGENILAKSKPDNPKYNLTGRFEYINEVARDQPLGFVLSLNQAGNWIEGVLSKVGNPQIFVDDPKGFYRFYAEIKDWSKPNVMTFISGNLTSFKLNIKLAALNSDAVQILINERPLSFKRVSGNPILTERHFTYFKGNPLAIQVHWFPLLSAQRANIKSYFKDFTGYRAILNYAKFNNAKSKINRTQNIRTLLVRAADGEADALESLAVNLTQFIDENIHLSDRNIAAFFIRYYLNQTSFDRGDGWRLTLASWLYRQLRINKKYQYRNFVKFIYGNTGGDKITSVGNRLYQYKIEVKVRGLGAGLFVKAGYYRGDITITCKQWEELGAKDSKGKKEAKLKIHFGELGGGLVKSVNFGQSFSGTAESDILWMPKDFEGLISILKAEAEAGIDLIKKRGAKDADKIRAVDKIRRDGIGISAGISGMIGMMEIVGNANLPALIFPIYSLGGVVGGVEAEPHKEIDRESKFGVEVTGSVVVGSIWKDGPLPAPKDVVGYGDEKMVLSKTYKGDGKTHFKHDSALLTVGAENLLRKMCANELLVLILPQTIVEITAHTDKSGSADYNKKLSKNRADNVKQKILDICGNKINAQIKAVGKGEELANIEDKTGSDYNPKYRRVDIAINGILILSLVSQ